MKERKTILFLYSELAGYFLACIRKLVKSYDVDIHIVRWELNKQAPFQFDIPSQVNLYLNEDFNLNELQSLVNRIDPDLVFCCGWMDDNYIAVCRQICKKGIPVIAGIDNHWSGTLKQHMARLVSRFTIKKYFSHIWVAGEPQEQYARKLGFSKDQILWGYYSADVDFFEDLYHQKEQDPSINKRYIYVGRYIEHKGLKDLWQAFIQMHEETQSDWELWCLGTGPLEPDEWDHPAIKHFGFVQPRQLAQYIKETDVFVLPSHNEPWGVVVHEFAAAGFPLICSDAIGAASAFLEHGKNGFLYKSGDSRALKQALCNMQQLSTEQLHQMRRTSARKAQKITPESWAKTLMSIV